MQNAPATTGAKHRGLLLVALVRNEVDRVLRKLARQRLIHHHGFVARTLPPTGSDRANRL